MIYHDIPCKQRRSLDLFQRSVPSTLQPTLRVAKGAGKDPVVVWGQWLCLYSLRCWAREPGEMGQVGPIAKILWQMLTVSSGLFYLVFFHCSFFYFVNVRLWAFLEFCTGSLHLRSLMYVFTSAWIALNAATSFHLSFLLFILCNTSSSFFFTVWHMALFYSISQCLFLVNFCYIWFHFTLYIGWPYYIWLYYMQIICSFRTWGVEAGLSTTRRCVDPASLDRKDRKSGYQHVSAGNQNAQNLTPPQSIYQFVCLFICLSVCLSIYLNLSKSN